jgi:hypothetical protein
LDGGGTMPEDHELIAFAAGLATGDVAARVEHWLVSEPGAYERLGDVVADVSRGHRDPTGVAPSHAVDAIVQANRPAPRGFPRIAAAVAVAAALLLAVVGFALRAPSLSTELADISGQLCAMEQASSRLPHATALDCGAPSNALLGSGADANLVELRMQLEAISDRSPDWLPARTMLALLEGDDAAVIRLLSEQAEAGTLPAPLSADLALALRRSGDEAAALEVIARARSASVGALPRGVEERYRPAP